MEKEAGAKAWTGWKENTVSLTSFAQNFPDPEYLSSSLHSLSMSVKEHEFY